MSEAECRAPVVAKSSASLISTVLGVGFVSGLIPAGLLPANVLNIEHAYRLSHSEMGRIVGMAMLIGGGIGGVTGGWVCGKIGAVRTVTIALFMAALSLEGTGQASSLAGTIGGLAGFFFSIGFLGASNVLATVMMPNRQRGLSLLHGVVGLGKLVGPAIASLFLYGAWRQGFVVAGLVPLAVGLPAVFLLRVPEIKSIGQTHASAGRPTRKFWLALLMFGLITGSELTVALWTPAYAQTARGFSAAQGNMLLATFSVGYVSGRFIMGIISKWLSARQTIAVCGVLLLSAIPAVLVTPYYAAAALFVVFGLSFSAIWPSYFAHISHEFPDHLAMMGGASILTGHLGFAICSSISGRIAEFSLAYALLFGAVTMAAFVALFFITPIGRPISPN